MASSVNVEPVRADIVIERTENRGPQKDSWTSSHAEYSYWPTDFYRRLNNNIYSNTDPRGRGWPLTERFDLILLLGVGYLAMVYYGPRYMKHRKPMELKGLMAAYNVVMVVTSLWMFLEFVINSRSVLEYFLCICQPHRISYEPSELRIVTAFYVYFLSKPVEFLDTAFMILKKKNSQITFLHIFHHFSMLFITFATMLHAPSDQAIYGPIINTFVHVVMYSYYLLSMFPALQPYLWWKKYLTQLQLVQFLLILSATIVNLAREDCKYPRWLGYIQLWFLLALVVLFSNFYVQSYLKDRNKRRENKEQSKTKSDTRNGVHNTTTPKGRKTHEKDL
ncbi:hypothetical protein RvY_06965 [Ramazzottius varieornatus]|uniref:Elongation of very long chain fatty acids protein n=1 Tax=Ramazzottius varieornatus TaxID=947166 RepID=A0A1D1V0R7_RAMVA|nr:hypothetical protein RvY_06965 [Ramazzottius varieornatus]